MNDLLYLTHRIPYPPNKGDKIRSYHLLRGMAEKWNVHLGTFIDDPNDWQYVSALEGLCAETKFVDLNPARAKIRALRGLLSGTSLTTPYYASQTMGRWVDEIADTKDIEVVVAYSSSMAQYAARWAGTGTRAVVDFCDMDSDKWRQYSEKSSGLKRWIYSREARMLRREETSIANMFDASVLISDDEVSVFCEKTGLPSAKIHTVRNGVDTEFFNPDLDYANPYDGQKAIVFVGAMDYWPNVDAVTWFAEEILPEVLAQNPGTEFFVVGSNPASEVRDLQNRDGVTVTGTVDDVRPYVQFASCVVAPLRVARGVQNKVLEAMAMARPLVASTMALEGISFDSNSGIRVCDTNSDWQSALQALLGDDCADSRESDARRHVKENFSWEASAKALVNVVAGA